MDMSHDTQAATPSDAFPASLRAFASSREISSASAEELSAIVVDTAFRIHRDIGPGLLASVYQKVLAAVLRQQGLIVETEIPVTFQYDGMTFTEDLRLDMLVNGTLIIELKSVETIAPVHTKQLLTYLRLKKLPLGLLINFGAVLFKDGCRRVVNNHTETASSKLKINQHQSEKISREGAKGREK
jgi:iron complex transport system substrate-binding protein